MHAFCVELLFHVATFDTHFYSRRDYSRINKYIDQYHGHRERFPLVALLMNQGKEFYNVLCGLFIQACNTAGLQDFILRIHNVMIASFPRFLGNYPGVSVRGTIRQPKIIKFAQYSGM